MFILLQVVKQDLDYFNLPAASLHVRIVINTITTMICISFVRYATDPDIESGQNLELLECS
jgi:hypothetical protein